MSRYAKLLAEEIPQSKPLDARQVKNNAGGFVYALDKWARLDRFLILGSDSATYYQSATELTRENAACVTACYAEDYPTTLARIVEVSLSGRAPKNDAAIFALALGASHESAAVRQTALKHLSQVCRTATHLFQFLNVLRALKKGWGRALKRAVAHWYIDRPTENVAYQAIKYRAREGFTHKRALELSHAPASNSAEKALFRWMKGKEVTRTELPELVRAHLWAMELKDISRKSDKKRLLRLIKDHRLPWEALPTEVTKDPEVWSAMLPEMGLTALIRNLGAMTSYGTLGSLSAEANLVCERLTDAEQLRKARVHPFNLLVALKAYSGGRSLMSRSATPLTWNPVKQIRAALEEAFYLSFKTVVPTGKRTFLALDVSGSMTQTLMNSNVECCEGAAAMAMTALRAEKQVDVFAFADTFRHLDFTAKSSLKDVLEDTRDVNFGGTDCALPMIYAQAHKILVDAFYVYTDNETWAGSIHPAKALRNYRDKTGIPAKLVVVGMTSTGFTIADPDDGGMMDVVGFDSAAPAVMADFVRG